MPIKLAGLAAGEEARVVVAAVDVGILNLTNYKPPAPDDYYLGQRRLTAEIRDLYGQLIDGMQGARGQIRSGGDSARRRVVRLAADAGAARALFRHRHRRRDGTAQVQFDIPAFAGTVRVMAVAWSKDKVGKASGDVIVRDPVVLTATLPRFLRTGDKGAVQLELDNVEGAAGDYNIAVATDGTVKLEGDKPQTLKLAAKQRDRIVRPGGAQSGAGPSTVNGEGQRAEQFRARAQLCARRAAGDANPDAPHRALARQRRDAHALEGPVRRFRARAPAASACRSRSRPRSTRRRCSTRSTAIRSAAPSRSPAGRWRCSTSTSLPRRHGWRPTATSISASRTPFRACWRGRTRMARSACGRSAATIPGSMPMSPISCTRARERGLRGAGRPAFTLALDRLRNYVATAPEPGKNGGRELAYALYVLARNGAAPIGDLRYLADTKISRRRNPDRQGADCRGAGDARRQGARR